MATMLVRFFFVRAGRGVPFYAETGVIVLFLGRDWQPAGRTARLRHHNGVEHGRVCTCRVPT